MLLLLISESSPASPLLVLPHCCLPFLTLYLTFLLPSSSLCVLPLDVSGIYWMRQAVGSVARVGFVAFTRTYPSLISLLGWLWSVCVPWHGNSALEEDTQHWKVTVPVQWPPAGSSQGAFKFAEISVRQLGLSMKRSRQESLARSQHFGCPVVSFVREVVVEPCASELQWVWAKRIFWDHMS